MERNGTGVDRTGAECAALSNDYIPTTATCNTQACDFCDGQDCSGHGTCNSAAQKCECSMTYTGTFCTVSPACPSGTEDSAGECCPSGVVSVLGECCAAEEGSGAVPVVDGNGRCCAQGVDACGVCGGSGNYIDAVYSLSPSAIGARYGYILSPLLRLVPDNTGIFMRHGCVRRRIATSEGLLVVCECVVRVSRAR
eukprot:5729815-Pyramimonas_sp.AAC.1